MPGLKFMRKSVKTFCFSSHVSSWHHSPPQFSASFLPTNPSFTNLSFCLSSSSCPLRACYRMPDTWWNDVKKKKLHKHICRLHLFVKDPKNFTPFSSKKFTKENQQALCNLTSMQVDLSNLVCSTCKGKKRKKTEPNNSNIHLHWIHSALWNTKGQLFPWFLKKRKSTMKNRKLI